MGAEQDAYMSVDSIGTPFAGGGLNTGLRDLARFGELIRNNGVVKGRQVIPALAATEGFLFDLVIDDQDVSQDWLKRGEVAAAITAHPGPLQGCDTHPLGALRYRATASPASGALASSNTHSTRWDRSRLRLRLYK